MNKRREQYLATLFPKSQAEADVIPHESPSEGHVRAALSRAYELRTFEIEHYWKRATYFWGFQIAIFAAFGLLWKQPAANDWSPITVALAGLGILTGVANALSARGSRFWQENWEHHIDMLEDTIEGRLYKTVWLDNGTISFSVSRINLYLSYYFVAFWIVAGSYVAWRFVGSPGAEFFRSRCLLGLPLLRACYVVVTIIAIALGARSLWFQRTKLEGTLPQANGCHGDIPIARCSRAFSG